MDISELKPNPRNPRKITPEKLEALRKSLDLYGDLSGVVFNRASGFLIGAHQRTKVLPEGSKITITEKFDPPTKKGTVARGHIIVDGESFSYREVSVDTQTELAMNLAANQLKGEWDWSLLPDIILELDAHNMDLEIIGFDDLELKKIMAPDFKNNEKEIDENLKIEKECPSCGYKW